MSNKYSTPRESTAAAALALDDVSPLWFDEIEIKNLDMFCITKCVLGQVFGRYGSGNEMMRKSGYDDEDFIIDDGDFYDPFSSDTAKRLWIEEIESRRAADPRRGSPERERELVTA